MTIEKATPPAFSWAVPKELGIPPDSLRLRLDFFHQSTVMTSFMGDTVVTTQVDAMDVARALASDLSFGTGLLPQGALWWRNTKGGPIYAIYVDSKIWNVALQVEVDKPPRRFTLPMPAFIFLCSPGTPPWVYAVKKKPTKETDTVYNAPLCNLHQNGKSCAGTHQYPTRIADIVQSFFTSFFTETASLRNRSTLYPDSVVDLWESLHKKKKFPTSDLISIATIRDLMNMEM